MKADKKFILIIALLVCVAFLGYFMVDKADTSKTSLSQSEIDGLIHMRQEEKLARDVYTVLDEKWNIRPLANISGSEQTHTSKVKELLEYYEIADPITDDSVGMYKDQKFTDLFNDLVRQGSQSLQNALKVGVTIEEMDIKDLGEKLKETDEERISIVYSNLKQASENHLEAFTRNLSK